MPRGKQFGYLFAKNFKAAEVGRTAAYEIGRGLFTLRHSREYTGEESKGKSDNLMDYTAGFHLTKYQWDMAHNPETAWDMWKSDEESMLLNYKNPIKIKWKPVNPPRLLENKKELKYMFEAGYEEPGRERTSFFELEGGSIVARYQDPKHINEEQFKYEISFPDDKKTWYELNIHALTDDCLSCDLISTIENIYLSYAKMTARMLLIEDAYILITEEDFDNLDASRTEAGAWIVAGVFGGKILKIGGRLVKEAFVASKTFISSEAKLYKLVLGSRGAKLAELSENELNLVKRTIDKADDLAAFIGKSLNQKMEAIANLWKTKYPIEEMFEGRTFFELIMREYRYTKAAGWKHTTDISHYIYKAWIFITI